MQKSKIDLLIIGQGLAGSLVAFQALRNNCSILVLDNAHKHSSTKQAAGMMTPIKGKRLTLNTSAQHIAETVATYQDIETHLNTHFLHARKTIKLVKNEEENAYFQKRLAHPHFKTLIQNPTQTTPSFCKPALATFTLDPVYQLDTATFLEQTKQHLITQQAYQSCEVDYGDFKPHKTGVDWHNYQAKKVIFCEGYKAETNPFFSHLNFKNAKGEILEIATSNIPKNTILNHGNWLCPSFKVNTYLYGTTTRWTYSNAQAEESGITELNTQLSTLLSGPFTHINTRAGIRPALASRIPIVDQHPTHTQLVMVTGLGGQGILNAPNLIRDNLERLLP